MSFPTFPATLTWNTPYRDRERVSMARYQSGVEQVERVGINRRSQSIDVNIRIQNAAEISTFLRERRGKPFRLRVDSQLLGEDLLYSCDSWEMPELGPNVWEFSATFNQERRFEPKIAQYLSLSAETLTVSAGQTIALTAGLSGFSAMPTLSWAIVSGPGTITTGIANLATYTAALNFYSDTAIVRVRVLGTDLEATVSLTVLENPGITSVQINPATVDRTSTDVNPTELTAYLNISGGAANAVIWSVRSGTAVLDGSTALTTNVLIPNLDQIVVIRATAIADSSKWAESIITVRKPALISGINVSASPSSILPGGVTQLSATVLGVGVFDPSVTWSIVSGGGTLNGTQYTAGPNIGSAVLEAVSVANSLIRQQVTIAIATSVTSTITSVSASASPNRVSNGSTTQLSAVVLGTGSFDSSVTWVVVSGPGTIAGNVLTATGVGTIIAKATSIQDGTKNGSVSIVVQASASVTGITASVSPTTITTGSTAQLTAQLTGTGAFNPGVAWRIVSGGGSISGTQYTAGSSAGTVVLTAASVSTPSVQTDVMLIVEGQSTVSSVTVSAGYTEMNPPLENYLFASVTGTGNFNQGIDWLVTSGIGTLYTYPNGQTTLTTNSISSGTIVVKGKSIQNPLIFGQVNISVPQSYSVLAGGINWTFVNTEYFESGTWMAFYDATTIGQANTAASISRIAIRDQARIATGISSLFQYDAPPPDQIEIQGITIFRVYRTYYE